MLRAVALGALALVAVVAVLFVTGTLKAYRIPSSAMEPTLHCARPQVGCEGERNDRVLALTRFVAYERGDLVVFEPPPLAVEECGSSGTFVKRIVGLPRERIELRPIAGRTHVFVDGQRLEEPYVADERRPRGRTESWQIPEGDYFVLGDNRALSCDSAEWGVLDGELLKGELIATYWPLDRIAIR